MDGLNEKNIFELVAERLDSFEGVERSSDTEAEDEYVFRFGDYEDWMDFISRVNRMGSYVHYYTADEDELSVLVGFDIGEPRVSTPYGN